jgi:hypothetical protein
MEKSLGAMGNCWFPATASPTFWISGAEADLSRLDTWNPRAVASEGWSLIQWVKYLTSGSFGSRLVYDIYDIGIGHCLTVYFNGNFRILNWRYLPCIRPIKSHCLLYHIPMVWL